MAGDYCCLKRMRRPFSHSKPRVNVVPRFSPTATNSNEITPGVTGPGTSAMTRNRMAGAIVGSAVIIVLVLSGIFFYLRRRGGAKSPCRAVDVVVPPTPNVPPYSTSCHTTGQRECGMLAQGQNPFSDRGERTIRDSSMTATSAQGQCGQLGGYSRTSASSESRPMSMRFAVSGSYRNSSHSFSSRATMSVTVIDAAHSFTADSPPDPVSRWDPVCANTNAEYSASWRGTNLSNIINAARGIKTAVPQNHRDISPCV
jgi:hypothetical protein